MTKKRHWDRAIEVRDRGRDLTANQGVYDRLATSSSAALYCKEEVTAVICADSTNTYDLATHTFSEKANARNRT